MNLVKEARLSNFMSLSAVGSDSFPSNLIELRLSFNDFKNLDEFLDFRNRLWRNDINPLLRKEASLVQETHNVPDWIWCLGEADTSGIAEMVQVFDYREFRGAPNSPFVGDISFLSWLQGFQLKDWGDCLIAGDFFHLYLQGGGDPPKDVGIVDPWIDSVLRVSRGIALWSCQVVELIKGIGVLTHTEADALRRGWAAQRPEAMAILKSILYQPTGQTLAEILSERTDSGNYYSSSPNFALANWLWKHWVNGNALLAKDCTARTVESSDRVHSDTGHGPNINSILCQVVEEIQANHDGEKSQNGESPCSFLLNQRKKEFLAGELVVIDGSLLSGYAGVALRVAQHVASIESHPVLYLTGSRSPKMIALEWLAINSNLELGRLQSGQLTDDEWQSFSKALCVLHKLPISIEAVCNFDMLTIAERATVLLDGFDQAAGLIVLEGMDALTAGQALGLQQLLMPLIKVAQQEGCPILFLSSSRDELEQGEWSSRISGY